jgi:hypothetical protein
MTVKRIKRMIAEKKGQFYIIAAVIIIIIIIGLASVSNYSYVKKKPKNFYDMTDILKLESKYIVDNSAYNTGDLNENIETYLMLFSDYMEKNTNEDFNLIILYGDINSGNITGRVYSRSSLGNVNIYLNEKSFEMEGGETIITNSTTVVVNPPDEDGKKTVNVTIASIENPGLNITQTLPVLEDSNFLFVMSTNVGFNQYVQTSLNKTATTGYSVAGYSILDLT